MTPAPTLEHQEVVGTFYAFLRGEIIHKGGGGGKPPCRVLVAPVDVLLAENTIVQPDIIVVCDPKKLENGQYVDGPPELVVEILSPSTALKDRREKRDLYESVGVAEYLIVDPEEHYAEHYRLDSQGGRYGSSTIWGAEDELALALLPELATTLSELFGWPVPEVKEAPLPYATN